MAAEVELGNGRMVISMKGLHKILAFKSSLKVPLEHVVGAELLKDAKLGQGLRGIFGTEFYTIINAGYYRRGDELEFWDVMDRSKAIVIELADERYARAVVEVEDPASTVHAIRQVIGSR